MKAVASCNTKHFKVNFKPTSLHEADNAETQAGQNRIKVQSPSAVAKFSPAPAGISKAMVAATFSFAINPQIAAYASRQSVTPIG